MFSFPVGPCRIRSVDPLLPDHPQIDEPTLSAYFALQNQINLMLGGYGLLTGAFDRFSRLWEPRQSISVLNLQCGRGDWAEHLRIWAHRRHYDIRINAVDSLERHIQMAQQRIPPTKKLIFDVRDIHDSSLLQAQQFDYVFCAMNFCRLSEEESLLYLKRINLLAKRGFVIIDGVRDIRRWLTVGLLSKIYADPSLSSALLHSVQRSFSIGETKTLVEKSGVDLVHRSSPGGIWMVLQSERAVVNDPELRTAVGWAGA